MLLFVKEGGSHESRINQTGPTFAPTETFTLDAFPRPGDATVFGAVET